MNLPVATCYGRNPCGACSNCSACKHCAAGGSCGVCASRSTKTINAFSSSPKTVESKASFYVGQCKALTKKGSRCKRSGDGGGYCWQHEK